MITPEKKKEIAARLKEALLAEHLYNAQAAKCLNLIPNYITMMLNKRMWDHCPAKAWTRTEEALSQGKIAEFKIPEGEKIVDGVKSYKKKGNSLIAATEPERNEPESSHSDEDSSQHKTGRRMTEEELENLLTKMGSKFFKTFTGPETDRLKGSLDIEINLIVNGKKVQIA